MSSPAQMVLPDSAIRLTPERREAVARLESWLARGVTGYARRRNFDFGNGDRDNVSTLSPYVRHRLVLEEEILAATLDRYPLRRVEKFVQEVFWRTYFKGWLEHRPGVWRAYTRDLRQHIDELDSDAGLRANYDAAVQGRTGIDCFDVWVQELLTTGYLHNHARMWFASIWMFTLRLPWELGADFFMQHLLDGDAASNTCSWRWVAGLHTQGKTYLARASNIREYTAGRFNPENQLASSATPLSGLLPPRPQAVPAADAVPVDGDFGILLTDDDCDPVSLRFDHSPRPCLALQTAALRSPMGVAPLVRAFSAGALEDAQRRLATKTQQPPTEMLSVDSADGVVQWVRRAALQTLVVAAPPQGPGADLLTDVESRLAMHDVRLLRLRRPYDDLVWPYARKGFFGLKKQIPALLAQLGLGADA
ncbi:MAG: FAD-binding domain-containing protein [Pseudomonadota bacterium]